MAFKVLIIDDEKNIPNAFKFMLEAKGGYEVTLAHSGKDGIEAAVKTGPDMIFLDIMMPGDDGIVTLKKIRTHEALSKIPVYMMTAVQTNKAKLETTALEIQGYLNKPLEMEDLMEAVETTRKKLNK